MFTQLSILLSSIVLGIMLFFSFVVAPITFKSLNEENARVFFDAGKNVNELIKVSDENQAALKRVVNFCNDYGHAKMGIQLAHAGRKGSTDLPWLGGAPIPSSEDRGWRTCGPSATPYSDAFELPDALDEDGLNEIKASFVQAARRADGAGFDVAEVHMAHGYLLHQFLSPLSNQRNDDYGGSLEGRMKFPLEVFESVRAVWPKHKALGVRFSATDWVDSSSWDVMEATAFILCK